MIDLKKARKYFKEYTDSFKNQDLKGFNLKITHTYQVINNIKIISKNLNLSKEDQQLAELIALLHDIGRFNELVITKKFDNNNFNHALYGSNLLFEDKLIRNFIEDNKYDYIIKFAIENHNKLAIEKTSNEKELLFAKLIRDADKIDIYRVNKELPLNEIYPEIIDSNKDIEDSYISDEVYNSIRNRKCVVTSDRKYPLDYLLCCLAFIFDINYTETINIIKDHNFINELIDRFNYTNEETKNKMKEIKTIFNKYLELK